MLTPATATVNYGIQLRFQKNLLKFWKTSLNVKAISTNVAPQEFLLNEIWTPGGKKISFCSRCRSTHTYLVIHITTPLTFLFSFRFIVQQLLHTICPLNRAEVVDIHSSVWNLPACLLPSDWLPGRGRPVDWTRNLLPLLCCHSAWFRLTVFLASLALQWARVNSILEPLPMLVLALIVCALSSCLAAFLRFSVWKRVRWPSFSQHHCLFFTLPPPFLLLLLLPRYVYNSPFHAHILLTSQSLEK